MDARGGHDEERQCWRWRPSDIAASPSRADGVPLVHERTMRAAAVGLIVHMASELYDRDEAYVAPARLCCLHRWRLHLMHPPTPCHRRTMRAPVTTAAVLFHRFFMRQSLARHDRSLIAAACFFLATKVDEVRRRTQAVVRVAYCCMAGVKHMPFEPGTPRYIAFRDSLFDAERRVLYTLEMDVAVDHPYNAITEQIKRWRDSGRFGPRDTGTSSTDLRTLNAAAAEIAYDWCVPLELAKRLCHNTTTHFPPPFPPTPPLICSMVTELCILFSCSEIVAGALWVAWHTVPVAPRYRLDEAHFSALVDVRLLRAVVDHYADMSTWFLAAEASACASAMAAAPPLPLASGAGGTPAGIGGSGGGGGGMLSGSSTAPAESLLSASPHPAGGFLAGGAPFSLGTPIAPPSAAAVGGGGGGSGGGAVLSQLSGTLASLAARARARVDGMPGLDASATSAAAAAVGGPALALPVPVPFASHSFLSSAPLLVPFASPPPPPPPTAPPPAPPLP